MRKRRVHLPSSSSSNVSFVEALPHDVLQLVLMNYLCAEDLASAGRTCKHLHAAVRSAANGNAESRLGCKLPTLPDRSPLDRLFWLERRNATLDTFDIVETKASDSTLDHDSSFIVISHKPSGLLLSLCSLSNGWVRLLRGDAVARTAPGFDIKESGFDELRREAHHTSISTFNECPPDSGMVCFGGSDFQGIELQDQDMEEEEVTAGSHLAARRDAARASPSPPVMPPAAPCTVAVSSLAEWLRCGEGDAPLEARTFSTWTLSTLKSEPGTISVKNNRMEVATLPPSCILRLTELGVVLPREESIEPAEGELLLGAV